LTSIALAALEKGDMMETAIIIRRAKKGDLEKIVENWKGLYEHHNKFEDIAYKRKANSTNLYRRYLKKQMSTSKAAIFVATKGQYMVGHIMVRLNMLPPIFVYNKEGYVDEIFVRQGFRGKGVGTRLLGFAKKWAQKKRLDWFGLTCHVKNKKALRVYRNFGLRGFQFKLVRKL